MKIIFVVIVAMALLGEAVAQDTNYWTQQYGTRSNLLGGAVIGSVSDMSATYYNPGAIALFKDASFLLSAKVYEFSTVNIKNGADEGRDLGSSSISPSPDLLAGSFTFRWLGSHKLGYSLLTRQRLEIDLQATRQATPFSGDAGEGVYGGELTLSNNLKELWAGLTWSYPLGPKIGLGITQFLAIRDQKRRIQVLAEALRTDGEVAASILITEYKYNNYRLLWKAGLGFDFSPLTLGLTVTTPSLNLFGSGSALTNSTLVGFDLDGDGQRENYLAARYQDDIPSHYESSLAIGLGGAYQFGKTKIHFSAEWFDTVDPLTVLDTQEFSGQTSGDTISFKLTHELQDVLNYGVGIEHAFGERFTGFASVVTDFTGAVPGSEANLSITNWDFYHFAAGAAFSIGRWELTLGAAYASAKDKLEPVNEQPGDAASTSLVDRLRGSSVEYKRIKLLFGFSLKI